MTWKLDPEAPPKPTFHNCIRCLRQYKLTIPYGECVPVNRDFCDTCLSELPYEERAEFAEETEDSKKISTGTFPPSETVDFPLYP